MNKFYSCTRDRGLLCFAFSDACCSLSPYLRRLMSETGLEEYTGNVRRSDIETLAQQSPPVVMIGMLTDLTTRPSRPCRLTWKKAAGLERKNIHVVYRNLTYLPEKTINLEF